MSAARTIADSLKSKVCVLVLESDIPENVQELAVHGADEITMKQHENLKGFTNEAHKRIVCDHISKNAYNIILAGSTTMSRDFLPNVAVELGTDVMTDCAALDVSEKGELIARRPGMDGKTLSIVGVPGKVQIASMRQGVLEKRPLKVFEAKEIEIEPVPDSYFDNTELSLVSFYKASNNLIDLPDAKIIVAGGRGIKTKESFDLLYKFAALIGAKVGCTRPCVDAGFALPSQQIGQTGVFTNPEIYIGFGISGAVQHIVGIKNTKYFISINQDPTSEIFKHSTHGVVGDCNEILRELAEG
jgi:Electron transfer flavoprotein, alpha subunit